MPEPLQQPDPEAEAPIKRLAPGTVASAAKLAELKAKYRLDTEVNLYVRGPDGKRMGKGPVLDDQVFNKFAELDNTRNKRYLDWMLFQAGGGQTAFDHSRDLWGDNTEEKTPEEFFKQFNEEKPDHTVYHDELSNIVQKLKDKGLDLSPLIKLSLSEQVEKATSLPALPSRFKALVKLLKQNGTVPGREERVAVEIIANKFKGWVKNQLNTKTRDRVHATSVYSRLIRGQSREEADLKWKEMEPRRRREYIFGDQDSLKWDAFGYNRHWPGRDNVYEHVYNAMRQFLINLDKVQRYNERIERYNAQFQQKGQTLPPNQRLGPRKPIPMKTDIGKVLIDAEGNLKYRGAYATVHSLVQANEQIGELPMKERVAQDIQYAGPKGAKGRGALLYSDENLDVRVPLTVAAAIEAGHPKWEISDPDQLANVKAQGTYAMSAWTKYAAGQHDRHFEWAATQGIPIMFNIKANVPPMLKKLLMTVFIDDLVDLQAPYVATLWRTGEAGKEFTFTQIIKFFKPGGNDPQALAVYFSLVRSFTKAMNVIKNWGKEFDPQDIIGDYVKHHRERMQGKRTLGEEIKIRAYQTVQALLE